MTSALGVIAAGHPLTARSGEQVLAAGGNAFDAALAALATSFVAEPVLASPGGGGFLLAVPADGPPRMYDFFVQTPRRVRPLEELDFESVHIDFGATTQEFHVGRGTIAVPGVVRGMFAVHRDLATIPMSELLANAVRHARDGVEVSSFQAYVLELCAPTYTATPTCRDIFSGSAGGLIEQGEVLRLPELASTLEALGHEGESLFYEGEIADALVRDLKGDGQLTREDLERYRVEVREPLTLDHRGTRVLLNPPPASGGLLVGFGLRLLDKLPHDIEPAEHVGALADVLAWTHEARLEAEAQGKLESVLDPELLERYRARVAGRSRSSRGTTHISIIDRAGNVASLSASNGEGSGHVVPGTGIVLNNMLGEEDLNPGGFQRWQPCHRMTSMMAPTAVRWSDGRKLATGSGGSNRIRTAILQVLHNVIDLGLPVQQAVDAPRLHYEHGRLNVEGGFDPGELRRVLDAYPDQCVWEGHNLFFGGAHTVLSTGAGFEGAGDPRRDGVCVYPTNR